MCRRRVSRSAERPLSGSSCVASDRQSNPEHSAGFGRVNRGYLPVVRFHKGSRNGKPYAHPFRLGGEKRFEHILQPLGGNPRPAIRY